MKITRIILSVIAALLAVILPFGSVVTIAVATPPQYSDTFLGVLDEKYERLHSIDEPKIVVVGGSSVAFGLDSKALERYTGMPVVNFGLYAALGTKLMLELSEGGIGKGDIVVIAPELDPQTMSLYFNSETTLQALDDRWSMMWALDGDDKLSVLGGMWSFLGDKLERMRADAPLVLDPIYNAANIDGYGDVCLVREENIMPLWYDKNTRIDLTTDMLGDGYEEFAEYLNDYIHRLELRGADVYFSFCPMNELALTDGSTPEARAELVDHLTDTIDCEMISSIDDYILEAGYFFDTNFHLNDAGVKVRTARLARDIRLAAGISGGIVDAEPDAPALPDADIRYVGEEDPNAEYFTYSVIEEGAYAGAYMITGLTEKGRAASELTVPLGVDMLKVVSIGEGALSGGRASRLTVTADTNLMRFENGAFSDSGISELMIYTTSLGSIAPPADFIGVASGFTVHLPVGMNESGLYEWSQRGLTFAYDLRAE